MSILKDLIKISAALDAKGMYKISDKISDILIREAQYTGMYDQPMSTRVIPFEDMAEEYKDVADKRRKYHPRYIGKEFEEDPIDDQEDIEESIFSLNGPPVSGIAQKIYDPTSMGYMGDKMDVDKKNPSNDYARLIPHQ